MKDLALKSIFLISIFLMVDYLIMITVGCASSYLGCTSNYFECTFCTIGKIVLLISSILFIASIMPDIKSLVKGPRTS